MWNLKSRVSLILILLLSSCSNDIEIEKLSSDSIIHGVSNKTKNYVQAVRLVEGINNSMKNSKETNINKIIKDVAMMYNQSNSKKEGNYKEIKIVNGILYTSHGGEYEVTILEKMIVLGERIK